MIYKLITLCFIANLFWVKLALSNILNNKLLCNNINYAELMENPSVLQLIQGSLYYKSDNLNRDEFSKVVAISNLYTGSDGCYIACIAGRKIDSSYYFNGEGYLVGQIRVKGGYVRGVCQPADGSKGIEISTMNKFQNMCSESFPNYCSNLSCWAISETYNWVAIKNDLGNECENTEK